MPTPPPSAGPPERTATIGPLRTFRYEAQSIDGKRITGVIDADTPEWVTQQLGLLHLRLVRLDPIGPADAAQSPPPASPGGADQGPPTHRGRPLRGDDFIAFNQQLAQLAKAGLPIESGLRLIARDMRSGRLAQTVRSIADELDKGTPIEQAFDKYRDRFPSLYGRLLGAGVRSGDLAGVLLGFGAHLEMLQRLRSALWRALSYPLAVLAALAVVLLLLGQYVIPRFADLYAGFARIPVYDYSMHARRPIISPALPLPTRMLLEASVAVPWLAGLLLAGIVLGPIVWQFLRARGGDRHVADWVAMRLPLVGRPIRLNLVARWCDALRIGVSAGLPFPEAVEMASDAVRSPLLRRDGRCLIARLEKGQPLSIPGGDDQAAAEASAQLLMLPATVPVAIQLASGHNDLPATLRSLTDLYERQAELRVVSVPAVLTPALVIVVAITIGFVLLALVLPMIRMIDDLTRMF